MEVVSRVEARPEYLSLEAAQAARTLVEEIMLVKRDENVVITADTATDARVVDYTAQAVSAAGAVPTLVRYETRPHPAMEPPAPVAGAIAKADVWIEFTLAYIMHSDAFRDAIASGARYTCLTAMDVQMLVDTIGRVRLADVTELGQKLCRLIGAADQLHITSPAGTDLTARVGGRPINLRGTPVDKPGKTAMLPGQASWNPLEETIQGTLVFDGAAWPPAELGLLRSPIQMTVSDGVVTSIEGATDARIYDSWMASHDDPNMYRIAHYSAGFNPGVTRPTGRIVEDERVFGCVQFGLGTKGAWIGGEHWVAAAHTDGTVLDPSIYVDGDAIEIDGRYVHPELVQICRRMGVAGY